MNTRDGLIHYVPSNGTEFGIFQSRCEQCRHCDMEAVAACEGKVCAWGILDRLFTLDEERMWFQPEDIAVKDADGKPLCPAACRRFTGRDDADGELRDPPPPDCEGQMTFGELDVPVEECPRRADALFDQVTAPAAAGKDGA